MRTKKEHYPVCNTTPSKNSLSEAHFNDGCFSTKIFIFCISLFGSSCSSILLYGHIHVQALIKNNDIQLRSQYIKVQNAGWVFARAATLDFI